MTDRDRHRPMAWKTITIAAVAAWLGVMVFFSFFVAPLAFGVDRTFAAGVVSLALPRYYGFGAVCCALALAGLLARGGRRRLPAMILCGVMLAVIAYSVGWVVPAVEAARAATDHVAFAHAHRLSVMLNLATMVAAAVVVALEALLPEPAAGTPRAD